MMKKVLFILVPAIIALVFWAGTKHQPEHSTQPGIQMARTGTVEAAWLDEISGLQASRRHIGIFWVHNDDGEGRLGAIDTSGSDLGTILIPETRNRDWEDITLVPGPDVDLLVIAETGDNFAEFESVSLLFVEEPEPGQDGRFSGTAALHHRTKLTYPDHPQDVEAVSWDPVSNRILLLSKRTKPPRLYAVDLEAALSNDRLALSFLGQVDSFRPPQLADRQEFGRGTRWISQPTALDISPDGKTAAVMTYRSLYLFSLPPSGDWFDGLLGEPIEIVGPPSPQEEAVGFTADGQGLVTTSEGQHAPMYVFRLDGDSGSGVTQ